MSEGSPFEAWVGRTEEAEAEARPEPALRLAATLDRDDPPPEPGEALPPGWHWLYFTPAARQSELGEDGHARRGGFLPPVPLARRMWAGTRFELGRPLLIGDRLVRRSRILAIRPRQGRSGQLVFVTVRHSIAGSGGGGTVEEQDIVFRDGSLPAGEPPRVEAPAGEAAFERRLVPTPALLFRFSALTFNGHRIHYDHPYATSVEGYAGLVVHGPLSVILMLDAIRRFRPAAVVERFQFRAHRPVTVPQEMAIRGRDADGGLEIWIEAAGGVASTGQVALRPSP